MSEHKSPDEPVLQFAVIADSHIRLPEVAEEGGYASNKLAVARAQFLVSSINRFKPDFVVHLGDIVHPIPALDSHQDAVATARQIFADLEAEFHALPGNHDIGDKPNAWLPAPIVDESSHQVFQSSWGDLYRSFSHAACQFVLLDTPVMNTGFEREKQQLSWLIRELEQARQSGKRIFIFLHYPLFICDPNEATHYDNLDEPARSQLLKLFEEYSVEAVFAGHVHNPFIGVYKNTKFYILPSTAFVRPEYSELASIAPGDEFGRNDVAKLGFFLVKIFSDRHEIVPVRTYGAGEYEPGISVPDAAAILVEPQRMLGMNLRQGWGKRIELAVEGLDEFRRKEAYRDELILALFELGVKELRVPFADLASSEVSRRMADLISLGFEFTVYSLGCPDAQMLKVYRERQALVKNWEMIFPDYLAADCPTILDRAMDNFSGSIFVAPVVPIKPDAGSRHTFQHFASHGFSSDMLHDSNVWKAVVKQLPQEIGLTFRVSPWESPGPVLAEIAAASTRKKLVNLQLPRVNEGVNQDDDKLLSEFIREAYAAASKLSGAQVFIDTFVDNDRGYYPRQGLLNRRFNPRPAFYALLKASRKLN